MSRTYEFGAATVARWQRYAARVGHQVWERLRPELRGRVDRMELVNAALVGVFLAARSHRRELVEDSERPLIGVCARNGALTWLRDAGFTSRRAKRLRMESLGKRDQGVVEDVGASVIMADLAGQLRETDRRMVHELLAGRGVKEAAAVVGVDRGNSNHGPVVRIRAWARSWAAPEDLANRRRTLIRV